jgi:hypothetical protein
MVGRTLGNRNTAAAGATVAPAMCGNLSPTGTAVLVQAVELTLWQVKQLRQWASVRNTSFHLWLAVDVAASSSAAQHAAVKMAPELKSGSVRVVTVNSSQFLGRYPGFAGLHASVTFGRAVGKPPGFMFHSLVVDEWRRLACADGQRYQFTWHLEPDVGFSGASIGALVAAYARSSTADLVCKGCLGASNWQHREVATSAFKAAVPLKHRYYTLEFAARYSDRLLAVMRRWIEIGNISQSEMMGCTVARNAGPNVTVDTLDSKHIGNPFKTSKHNCIKKPHQWTAAQTRDAKGIGRLYHPVKM